MSAPVIAVASRPDLNGAVVQVVRFLPEKGRYAVLTQPSVASGTKAETINLKPTSCILTDGSAVIVAGLMAAPELNGRRGVVEGFARDRYTVRIDAEPRLKNLKLTNYCQVVIPDLPPHLAPAWLKTTPEPILT